VCLPVNVGRVSKYYGLVVEIEASETRSFRLVATIHPETSPRADESQGKTFCRINPAE
jgi:hypothetical protein